MTIFQDARVLIFTADAAQADSGKLHALGVGFNVTRVDPQINQTPPQTVVAIVDVPPRYIGSSFSLSLELRREDTNTVVTVPGPTGPQALRIQQTVEVQAATLDPGFQRPESLGSRHQMVMAFPTGLQLEAGASYRWRAEIDGQSRPSWHALFHVLALRPGVVFGGPSAPPDPSLPPLGQDEEDTEPPPSEA